MKLAKKFYTSVDVIHAKDGFAIVLDGSGVHTPAGALLKVANKDMASAIADEWQSQGDKIIPASMPITAFACTAIDRAGPLRKDVIGQSLKYGAADLLCYRAASPGELAARQNQHWQPLLDWLLKTYQANMRVTNGIIHVEQSSQAMNALGVVLEDFDAFELVVVFEVSAACGSLVVALALMAGRINADEACDISQLDEGFQNERWGEDREDMERRQRLRDDICAAARFLTLT